MAKIVKEIKLETSKQNIIPAIVAKQNDCDSRFLKVTFLDEGKIIPIELSSKVTINAERKDGESNSFFGEVNGDNTATVPLHSWMLELDGIVNCDVSIIDIDGRKLTTTTFVVMVEKAAHGADDISTNPQYDVLLNLIADVNETKVGVANAIKVSASGNPVCITDSSNLEHAIKVKLSGSESGGKNLFHFPTNETVSGKYEFENPEDEEGYGNPTWSYTTEGSKMTISDPCGDITSMIYKEYYLRDLLKEVDPNKTLTISVTGDHPAVDVYIGDVCLYAGDTVENFTFTLSDLDENASLSLMSYGGEGTIYIQIEEGETATEYEDYVGSEKTGFYVEEVFNSSEMDQFGSDITESGIYVIESVFTSEDSDATEITFKDGKEVKTSWIEGKPFAEGDMVYVEVNGDNQIFSIMRGAVVQKYGLNLFDQETFCASQGFKKQTDGSWLGSSKFIRCFTLSEKKKGSMYIRLEAKLASGATGVPFYMQLKYTDRNPVSFFELRYPQSEWKVFEYITDPERTVEYIQWTYSGTAQTDAYYVKEMMISYADAPYEPYKGDKATVTTGGFMPTPIATLTADEEGNIRIVGNGESITLIAEDGVTIDAEYNVDTKTYIDKKFAELAAMIVNS